MSFNQGLFHFSSGSLKGGAGCSFVQLGSTYRASSLHGGTSCTQVPISSGRPIWLAPEVGETRGCFGGSHGDIFLGGNEKLTMQNLNDRLAAYLDKVRALEAANVQLENSILEWHKGKSIGNKHDFNQYEKNITDMQGQIENGRITNADIVLKIDNAKMATEDFRVKLETEKAIRQGVQTDVENLRKELDNMTIIITDLEMEIEGMREDHILKKKEHEEDVGTHHSSWDFKVDVKVNATPQEDLARILAGIREDYEAIIEKNRHGLDAWYKEQTATVALAETPNPEEIQKSQSQISELKRSFQTLDIDLQTEFNKKHALEGTLAETKARYALELKNIQQTISKCEEELGEIRHDIKCQNNQYKILLGIKTRLEKEISTYRKLLEGTVDG
uniref:Keratin 23 n=1 Tax=Sphenodon punctatus TaxID=8508 RepID=A0A8D0L9M6_SPHPU